MRKHKTVEELKRESEQLVFNKDSKRVIVRPLFREEKAYAKSENENMPQPQYGGSNMALVGVLKKGETLERFRKKWLKQRIKLTYGTD